MSCSVANSHVPVTRLYACMYQEYLAYFASSTKDSPIQGESPLNYAYNEKLFDDKSFMVFKRGKISYRTTFMLNNFLLDVGHNSKVISGVQVT